MANWWTRVELLKGRLGEHEGCAASRMWRSACATLRAAHADRGWAEVSAASAPDSVWHSLTNCVAYQAGVWQGLVLKGMEDATHPAAFRLAVVLRHTPPELAVRLVADKLRTHPQAQELMSYIVSLLTDDSPWCECNADDSQHTAPLRDLLLFGDCEAAVLAASREEYDAHAKRQRAAYSAMAPRHYVELRIKILNQLIQVPKIYQTPEFECFESAARENVDREICTLREHLLTGRHD
ncbi:uncharacterized protein LOC123711355 isoform X1 [Pieris brassicae]|nr:uncharacterized protein LOC123711355 isoform X1 [Pieris brassicae]XP_045519862.1 uncharacterized protein LOC123711355 isoform X1 [Pieris brassicae]